MDKGLKLRYVFLLIIGSVFLFSIHSDAQINKGGSPYSFGITLEDPVFIQPNQEQLRYKSDKTDKDCSAMEFARYLSLGVDLQDAAWQIDELPDASVLYRLAIYSPGAQAVGPYFKDFYIPDGASLFIYSPDHTQKYGAFTSDNNRSSGLFAIEFVLGDRFVIEYQEPKNVRGQGHFTISEVLHAYRGVYQEDEKGYGNAGACEVNVNCPEGSARGKQRDAVLRLLIKKDASASWCSGSLINNTLEDRTPYVITADHCGKNSSPENHALWMFYFHYESADCENPLYEPEHQTMLGCEEIASSSNAGILGSDFYLVQLLEEIPEDYNPFFLGWNRTGLASHSGYTIHHPQGDIKKISTYTTTLKDATYQSGMENGFWEVTWSETESGYGVTEGGSSGSPIFDNNGYLIGTLTGGYASCNALEAPDYYGKFSEHWMSNGDSEDQQLMPWLDPINSGVQKMGGIYLGIDELAASEKLFNIQPNPVVNQLNLTFSNNASCQHIQVFNIMGRILKEYTYQGSETLHIDFSRYQKGIYFIRVESEESTQTLKVLKL